MEEKKETKKKEVLDQATLDELEKKLQGIKLTYYREDGESTALAAALRRQYQKDLANHVLGSQAGLQTWKHYRIQELELIVIDRAGLSDFAAGTNDAMDWSSLDEIFEEPKEASPSQDVATQTETKEHSDAEAQTNTEAQIDAKAFIDAASQTDDSE